MHQDRDIQRFHLHDLDLSEAPNPLANLMSVQHFTVFF
jgi:hypothetical protein